MPLISGPTQLLPFSQHFDYGYTAYRRPEFIDVFRSSMVQLELAKGDAVFFNPALFHAAGDNDSTDFDRWANLFQVSACWGKPMESVDATAVLRAVWPHVQNLAKKSGHDAPGVQALLKAICDGYSFPTNLDKDPPPPDGVRAEPVLLQDSTLTTISSQHCPPTQLDRAFRALESDKTTAQLEEALERYEQMRLP
jgi:ectoine hydroxylase-related dioxygenase (phytanoyl-CoA dioxygenase family)